MKPAGRRRALAAAAASMAGLVVGCATPALEPGLLSGRLALQVAATSGEAARQVSGSFELRGDAQRGQLDLVSPLGTVLVRARWEPGRAELETSGERSSFTNLDELSRRSFGEPLPLGALFDWLRGRPWPGAPSVQASDGAGFEQLGWAVDTGRAAQGQIIARRAAPPAVTLRARLDQGS